MVLLISGGPLFVSINVNLCQITFDHGLFLALCDSAILSF